MPEPVDLSYAIKLDPEDAIAYFRAKGYAISWDWQDVWQAAHNKSFTVAKALEEDVLRDIRELVDEALAEGITFRDFQKQLEPKLRAKGWWGRKFIVDPAGNVEKAQLGSPWRLRTIYDTNLQVAYSAGHRSEQLENIDSRPWWQYVGILDSRIRPAHRALHGLVFRFDDPFWQRFYPPNGWNCRCTVRALTRDQMQERIAAGSSRLMVTNEQPGFRELDATVARAELGQEEVLISEKTGELGTRATITFTDREGRKLTVKTDAGWSYAPE